MVTLQELKAHLRIEQDEEDGYLTALLAAAKTSCEDFCGRPFSDDMPEPVRLAMLLMAGHFFTHRENSDRDAYEAMFDAFHALLWPYREPGQLF